MINKGRILFEFVDRQIKMDVYKHPLQSLNEVIEWNKFHQLMSSNFEEMDSDKLLLFKILVLQDLYGLSDIQTEFHVTDSLTFMRFLGLKLSNDVPDQNVICKFRDILIKKGILDALFDTFFGMVEEVGIILKKGRFIEPSIVTTPITSSLTGK